MHTTITITDDSGTSTAADTSQSHATPSEPAITVVDAGPAPGAGGATIDVTGNGQPGADGQNGGAAPEWLHELLQAGPTSPGPIAESVQALPAIDAGGAPAR